MSDQKSMNYREENEKSQKTIDRINERWRKAGKLSSKTIFGNDADAVTIVNVASNAMSNQDEEKLPKHEASKTESQEMSPEELEKYRGLSDSQKTAYINQRAKDRGRYYENGGIFKSNNTAIPQTKIIQPNTVDSHPSVSEWEKLPKYDARRGRMFRDGSISVRLPREGVYRYDWGEYCWETGGSIGCVGCLTIEESEEETDSLPHFCWHWEYSCEFGSESFSGNTLAEFTESFAEALIVGFDADSFVSSLANELKIRPYVEALDDLDL